MFRRQLFQCIVVLLLITASQHCIYFCNLFSPEKTASHNCCGEEQDQNEGTGNKRHSSNESICCGVVLAFKSDKYNSLLQDFYFVFQDQLARITSGYTDRLLKVMSNRSILEYVWLYNSLRRILDFSPNAPPFCLI